MTTLREAAQQALEALEADCGGRCNAEYNPCWQREVAETLRAALVEDAMQKFTDVSQEIEAALAEPVQEPVAKVDLMTTGGNAGLATRIVEIDDHLRERLRPGQLLYTAPPQRKPLTEEEIKECERQAMVNGSLPFEQRVFFARAIERAHGITS